MKPGERQFLEVRVDIGTCSCRVGIPGQNRDRKVSTLLDGVFLGVHDKLDRLWRQNGDPNAVGDCGITDVEYAIAETGSLVIRPHAGNGRGLSLVPMIHVAIVEPKNILPDLADLMEKLAEKERSRANVILIAGPSKTADIEMNVVTGVHGPNVVQVLVVG